VLRARELQSEALAAARAAGAERFANSVAQHLAETEFHAGNAEAALQMAAESLAGARKFNDMYIIVISHSNMAAYLVSLGRYDEARIAARDALAMIRETQYEASTAFALQHLAAVAALRPTAKEHSRQEYTRAARLLGDVDALLAATEALREYTEQQEYEAVLPVLREKLGEADFANVMAEGRTWSEDQALSEAMLI
jgi:Arc/MetJ family transcription regulator